MSKTPQSMMVKHTKIIFFVSPFILSDILTIILKNKDIKDFKTAIQDRKEEIFQQGLEGILTSVIFLE